GIEAAYGDQRGGVRGEERIGLQRARPLEALAGDVRGQIEQQRRYTGVGEMRGNLSAHRARAEDRNRSNGVSRIRHDLRTVATLRKRSTTASVSASSE